MYPWSSNSPGKGTKAIAEEFGDLLSDLRIFSDVRRITTYQTNSILGQSYATTKYTCTKSSFNPKTRKEGRT